MAMVKGVAGVASCAKERLTNDAARSIAKPAIAAILFSFGFTTVLAVVSLYSDTPNM
jgi:hypothetical protein